MRNKVRLFLLTLSLTHRHTMHAHNVPKWKAQSSLEEPLRSR